MAQSILESPSFSPIMIILWAKTGSTYQTYGTTILRGLVTNLLILAEGQPAAPMASFVPFRVSTALEGHTIKAGSEKVKAQLRELLNPDAQCFLVRTNAIITTARVMTEQLISLDL